MCKLLIALLGPLLIVLRDQEVCAYSPSEDPLVSEPGNFTAVIKQVEYRNAHTGPHSLVNLRTSCMQITMTRVYEYMEAIVENCFDPSPGIVVNQLVVDMFRRFELSTVRLSPGVRGWVNLTQFWDTAKSTGHSFVLLDLGQNCSEASMCRRITKVRKFFAGSKAGRSYGASDVLVAGGLLVLAGLLSV